MIETIKSFDYYSKYGVPKAGFINLINDGIVDMPFWDVDLTGVTVESKVPLVLQHYKEYSPIVPEMVVITLYEASSCQIVSVIKVHRSHKRLYWEKPTLRSYIPPFKIHLTFYQNPAKPGMYREQYWRGINYNRYEPVKGCSCTNSD